MNSRHIAFIGIAATSLLATLAGCSASDTSTPVKKPDGGTTSSGAAGAGSTTTGAAGDGTTTGASGTQNHDPTGGAGGAAGGMPAMCDPPPTTTKAQVADAMGVLANFEDAAPGAVMSVTPGGGWYSYTDSEVGAGLPAMFTPAPGAFAVEAPGNGGMGSALHVVGTGFAG